MARRGQQAWRYMLRRDGNRCGIHGGGCGQVIDDKELCSRSANRGHIIPRSLLKVLGITDYNNLESVIPSLNVQPMHRRCNAQEKNTYPSLSQPYSHCGCCYYFYVIRHGNCYRLLDLSDHHGLWIRKFWVSGVVNDSVNDGMVGFARVTSLGGGYCIILPLFPKGVSLHDADGAEFPLPIIVPGPIYSGRRKGEIRDWGWVDNKVGRLVSYREALEYNYNEIRRAEKSNILNLMTSGQLQLSHVITLPGGLWTRGPGTPTLKARVDGCGSPSA